MCVIYQIKDTAIDPSILGYSIRSSTLDQTKGTSLLRRLRLPFNPYDAEIFLYKHGDLFQIIMNVLEL